MQELGKDSCKIEGNVGIKMNKTVQSPCETHQPMAALRMLSRLKIAYDMDIMIDFALERTPDLPPAILPVMRKRDVIHKTGST